MKSQNAIYAQSGGVTSVINATAAAVIETSRKSKKINKLYAGKDGIIGILNEELIDTSLENRKTLKSLQDLVVKIYSSLRRMNMTQHSSIKDQNSFTTNQILWS